MDSSTNAKMVLSIQECLDRYGSYYAISKEVAAGNLVKIERGIYSDSKEYVPGEGIGNLGTDPICGVGFSCKTCYFMQLSHMDGALDCVVITPSRHAMQLATTTAGRRRNA